MYDFSHKLLLWLLCVKNHSHILMGHVINRWWSDNKMEGVTFCHFYFIYMTSMTNDKVTWSFNCHYNDLKRLKFIWYEHIQPYPPPTYIPTYFLTQPPTHPSTYLPTYLLIYLPTTYLLTEPLIYLLTYFLNANQPTHDPPTYLLTHQPTHLLTYLLFISYLLQLTYLLPNILQLVYYLFHNHVVIWNKHVKLKTWQNLNTFWCCW
jgi:hypothetical protein